MDVRKETGTAEAVPCRSDSEFFQRSSVLTIGGGSVVVTMLRRRCYVSGRRIWNNATARPNFLLSGGFRVTRIQICLALVKSGQFLGWNEVRDRPVRVGMNLLNLVTLLLR
jgi:hypothetical protein